MYKLYLLNTDTVTLDMIDMLSDERKRKVSSYIYEKDKKLSLGAGILLDTMLKTHNLREKDMLYSYNKYGKPYFINYPYIYYNISHSEKMCILVEDSKNIGCDIEKTREYDKDIIDKCFSIKEKENINKTDNKNYLFTQIWTAKEAFLKNIGLGLSNEMNNITIDVENNKIIQNISDKEYKLTSIQKDDYLISIIEEK